VPSRLAADASALFSRNLFNFLSAFWDKEAGRPVLDAEIGDAVRLTQGGKVVNARLSSGQSSPARGGGPAQPVEGASRLCCALKYRWRADYAAR